MEESTFNFEKSLWDTLVIEITRQGNATQSAIAHADAIIQARRNTFSQEAA